MWRITERGGETSYYRSYEGSVLAYEDMGERTTGSDKRWRARSDKGRQEGEDRALGGCRRRIGSLGLVLGITGVACKDEDVRERGVGEPGRRRWRPCMRGERGPRGAIDENM